MPLVEIGLKLTLHYPIRALFLKILGAKIGKNTVIYDIKLLHYCEGSIRNLIIGNNVYIAPNVTIDLRDKVIIKDNVTISPNVLILTHVNSHNKLSKLYPFRKAKVTIKENSWICASSTILCGTTIGKMSVIGACSLVREDVKPYTLVAGVPAKKIREFKN